MKRFLPYFSRAQRVWVSNAIQKRWKTVAALGLVVVSVGLGIGIFLQPKKEELVFKKDFYGSYNAYIPSTQLSMSLGTESTGAKIQVKRGDASLQIVQPLNAPRLDTAKGRAVYTDASQNVELHYTLQPKGLKEDIILKKRPQEHLFASQIRLSNITAHINSVGIPIFTDKQGSYQFHFERPYAIDANGERTDSVRYHLVPAKDASNSAAVIAAKKQEKLGTKKLFGIEEENFTDQDYVLMTEVDPKWLQDPKRAYPVTIDPTVVHDTSSEFATGQFNNGKDIGSGSSPNLQTQYGELPADEYTVGLWHFDELVNDQCSGGEDACDSSGNGNDGTQSGGASINTTSQRVGAAARTFDGTDDFITVADSNELTFVDEVFTAEAWIKRSSTPAAAEYVLMKGAASNWEYSMILNTTSLIQCQQWTTAGGSVATVISNSTVTDGNWHHVACVSTGTSWSVYIDGKLDNTSNAFSSTMGNGTASLFFGDRSDAANAEFQGDIDEIRISNIARSAEEIAAAANRRPYSVFTSDYIDFSTPIASWNNLTFTEYNVQTGDGETATSSSGLVAAWNMNATSGTTVTNDAGAGTCGGTASNCDGTLTNVADTTGQDVAALSGWTANDRKWGAGAINFDGTNDYVDIANTSALDVANNGSFSVEGWIKGTANGRVIFLAQNDGDHGLIYWSIGPTTLTGTANKLVAYLRVDGVGAPTTVVSGATTINDNYWHHVALTSVYNGSTRDVTMYVDGKVDATTTMQNGAMTFSFGGTSDIIISAGSGGYTFRGTIDTVRWWSRGLSSSDILNHAQVGGLELQTRVGSDTTPEDGGWEDWKPVTSETAVDAMENVVGWATPSATTVPGVQIATSSSTVIKAENTQALKVQTGAVTPAANQVALWHFEETSGTGAYLKDTAPTATLDHGTPTGTTSVDGVTGKGRSFNGSSDVIAITDSADIDFAGGSLTISLWVKPGSTQGASADIFSKHNGTSVSGYALEMNGTPNSNVYYFTYGNGTGFQCTASTITLQPNVWQHVAITKSSTSVVLYVNGASANTCTGSTATVTGNSDTLYFSRFATSAARYWNGSMDEVYFSTAVATADEIQQQYKAGRGQFFAETLSSTDLSTKKNLPFYVAADRPGQYLQAMVGESGLANYEATDSNLRGFWHLEEEQTTGTLLKDATGNGNSLAISGAAFGAAYLGGGRVFDGTNDVISCTDANCGGTSKLDPGSGSWSIGAWVNTTRMSLQMIMAKGTGAGQYAYQFPIYSGSPSFQLLNQSSAVYIEASASARITDGRWHHVVGTYDGTTAKIYIDGVLQNSSTTKSGLQQTDSTSDFQIGGRTDCTTCYFGGTMDEPFVAATALTADQIRQMAEVKDRTFPVTIDFGASLESTNLITASTDLTFDIDGTDYGASNKGDNLYWGDKIIVKENVDGTEYIAQGTVQSVNQTSGAVRVVSWDSGSTFPSGGFTTSATVFKWERQYWNITKPLDSHLNAVTRLTFWNSGPKEGHTIYFDDFRSATDYLTTPGGSTITSSTGYRFLQYRMVQSLVDYNNASPSLTSITLDYSLKGAPNTPTLDSPADGATNQSRTPALQTTASDSDSDYIRYKIEICTNSGMTADCQTFDQTTSQTGWSGQNTETSTAYTSGTQATFTVPNGLLAYGTTYYWRSYAVDPGGSNTWSGTQGSPRSFTTIQTVYPPSCTLDKATDDETVTVRWTDIYSAETNYTVERNVDSGGFSSFSTPTANATSAVDNTTSSGHTYQYRVRANLGSETTQWCTTSTITTGLGVLNID